MVEVDADGAADAADGGVEEALPADAADLGVAAAFATLLSARAAESVRGVENDGRGGGDRAEVPCFSAVRVQNADEGEEELSEHGWKPRRADW